MYSSPAHPGGTGLSAASSTYSLVFADRAADRRRTVRSLPASIRVTTTVASVGP